MVVNVGRFPFDAPSKDNRSPIERVLKFAGVYNRPVISSGPRVDKAAYVFQVLQEEAHKFKRRPAHSLIQWPRKDFDS